MAAVDIRVLPDFSVINYHFDKRKKKVRFVLKIVEPSAELRWITPDAEKEIERAGRTCYKSEDKITGDSAGKFIRMVMERGHHSVLEHASASFRFVCDRGVTHELVRHRLVSYSQESTRYCNYSKSKFDNQITVIQPPGCERGTRNFLHWKVAVEKAEEEYMEMINDGVSPQIARSVLPNCLKTEIAATCNLREWRHIFKLRTAKAAHPQIREIMDIALTEMKTNCPNVFSDF